MNTKNTLITRIKAFFLKGVRHEETGGFLNYYTLKIRDKTMEKQLQEILTNKYDWAVWFVIIGTGVAFCIYIANYFNH